MFADRVVPFVFEHIPVRGEVIYLARSWRRMLKDHDYEPVIREALGHAAAATGLIAQSLKFEGAVTMQIQGAGDLRMLVMQCTSDLELRGMATPGPDIHATSFDGLMADAHCAITVDAGERPYQGIVEVNRDSLAANLENYFARSVQVPSHVVLVSNDDLAGGILLQQMPGRAIELDDWNRLGYLAATLATNDFPDTSGVDLIRKLFNEDDIRVFEEKPVIFRCRCSQKRAEDILRMLGPDETRETLEELGSIEITCEFCGRMREFDEVDVTRLFADNVVRGPETRQ